MTYTVYTFHDNSEDTMAIKDIYKIMSSHIICSLTDRAAANHAAIQIVNEKFGNTLVEVNCHLHPLYSIASKFKVKILCGCREGI